MQESNPLPLCAWDGCDRAVTKRGYCDRCYGRARKAGVVDQGRRLGTCADCGVEVVGGRAGAVPKRCHPCAKAWQRAQGRAWIKEHYVPIKNVRTCQDCGGDFDAPGRDTRSLRCPPCRKKNKAEWTRRWAEQNAEKAHRAKRKWHEANRAKVKADKHRRRVLARDVEADQFNAQDIYERDNWTCQLCGLHLDPAIKFPSNDSPSIDHIIPISLGGTHTLANVQAACMGCNRRKGGRRLAA